MSFAGALAAERIKLTTTRSPVWAVIAVAVLSIGLAMLLAAAAYSGDQMPPEKPALGVALFGVPVLMVLASLTVTGEYRSGMIRTTFLTVPDRTAVLAAKATVAAVYAGGCAAAVTFASLVAAGVVASPYVATGLSLTESATWRPVWAVAVYAALAAVLGVAVGALLRVAAGAVALLLLWPLVVETILGSIPELGPTVGPWLPFTNAMVFTGVPWINGVYAMHWGPLGALVYFAAVVVVLFAVACVVVNRRDA